MPFDDELPQREPFKHWSVRRVAGTGRRERDAPMSRPAYWSDSFEPATRLLPDVRPRAGTVVRALLAVTAGVRAPLLSLTGRARFARRPPPVAAPREALVLGGRRPRCARPDTAKPSPGGRPPVRGEPPVRDCLLAPDFIPCRLPGPALNTLIFSK